MKKILISALILASASAYAFHCPADMKAIDAKIATEPKLSAADLTKVQALRAEGETLHKAGKHDDSIKALSEAKKLLGI